MRKEANKYFGIIALTFGLSLCATQTTFAKGDDYTDEDATNVLKTPFSFPMKFSTDSGELTLTFTNRPDEENVHYLRPANLPNASDFISISHMYFMNNAEKKLTEETTLRAKLMAEMAQTKLLSPEKQMEYLNVMMGRNADSADQKQEAATDNAIYPLQYQSMNLGTYTKFAFANSVVTVDWLFQKNDDPQDYADLNIFQDKNVFFGYAQKCFAEFITTSARKLENDQFSKIQPLLYL